MTVKRMDNRLQRHLADTFRRWSPSNGALRRRSTKGKMVSKALIEIDG
jgi:ribosomal protein S6E (S10)